MIVVDLPLRTHNPLNGTYVHWRTHRRTQKRARGTACLLVRNACLRGGVPIAEFRGTVTLTRLSAGELDDDGLRSALKAVRDGVADAFETDDSRKSRLKFEYAQAKCKRGAYGVRVEIEHA